MDHGKHNAAIIIIIIVELLSLFVFVGKSMADIREVEPLVSLRSYEWESGDL